MKLKFCGAAQYVTGSCHLVTLNNGYKILLDCGLFQGGGKDVWDWNNKWLFNPEDIDCVVLSHAHIDHTGRVPKLVQDGFRGNIFSTNATRSLSSIMLADSAYIQERDVEYYNRKIKRKKKSTKPLREPLYTSEIIPETMGRFIGCGFDRWIPIGGEAEIMYRETGHILGAASVVLKTVEDDQEVLLGFTGDIGRPDRPILRDPKPMIPVDFLISESTYGDRIHEDKPAQSKILLDILRRTCVENKGKLLIPAFSVGRTQEIVYMLDQMANLDWLPRLPVYVDSPLAVNATNIFIQHPECYDRELLDYLAKDPDPFGFNGLRYIKQVEDSKALNKSDDPAVIISAAGMLNAGRSKHHLANIIEDPRNAVLLVGYCTPETPGGMLKAGIEEIKLFGDVKKVRAQIETMDSFSAHGDQKEMLDFLENQRSRNRQLFLVHGEKPSQQTFKKVLKENGHRDIEIPEKGQEFNLTI
ncbi:MAG: MBL fold metallo-hydrolase [Saprospiraceae bacterium]|nr:MBL fold metallo-hydrolase [Saprospiraceae bacterium]